MIFTLNPSGYLFPISKNAVTLCWARVRERSGLPHLQFRDLRHLGATDWVRRGLSTHSLKHTLGHSTIATAQFYVDLVGEDQINALDKAMAQGGVVQLPPSSPQSAQSQRNQKRAQRLNRPKEAAASQLAPGSEAAPSASQMPGSSPAGVDEARAAATAAAAERKTADATHIFLLAHGRAAVAPTSLSPEVASNVVQFRPRKAA